MNTPSSANRWLAAALVLCGVLSNLASSAYALACADAQRIVTAVGDNQTGAATAPLGQSVGVRVQCVADHAGGLIGTRDEIVWTVTSGGGRVNGATTTTTTTTDTRSTDNPSGNSTVNWQLGPTIGLQTLTASVAGHDTVLSAQAGGPASGGTCTAGAGTTFDAQRDIVGDENWTLAGSPYRAESVQVRDGATLTIEAGVTACLQRMLVNADSRLVAAGQAGATVRLTARDSIAGWWFLQLGGDHSTTGPLPASVIRHVSGEHLLLFSNVAQPLLMEDSSLVVNSAARNATGCAKFEWSLPSAASAGTASAVRRVVLDGFGGTPVDCPAGVTLTARAVPTTGPMTFEARVLRAPRDGVYVGGAVASAFALVNCEVSGSGRNGVVLDGASSAPAATIVGCHIVDNIGYGVLNLRGTTTVALAQGNWWGNATGAATTGANAVSVGVDASNPATTPPLLGY